MRKVSVNKPLFVATRVRSLVDLLHSSESMIQLISAIMRGLGYIQHYGTYETETALHFILRIISRIVTVLTSLWRNELFLIVGQGTVASIVE